MANNTEGRYWPTVIARVAEERKKRALEEAAPALLAACESLLRFKDELLAEKQGEFFQLSTWDEMRSAVKKARSI